VAWRFHASGLEHLPPRGPFILSPNHQSYLDVFLLVGALPYRVFRRSFFVGASEYFATPLRLWIARRINVVPVDPDTNLVRAMQAGAYGLRRGKVLIVFPEGERSIDGSVKRFKKGAAILSLHLGVPIVPVALDGAFDVWPRNHRPAWRAMLPGSGLRVLMRMGAALDPRSAGGASHAGRAASMLATAEHSYAAATERLRSAVQEMWEALRALRVSPRRGPEAG
jgi:1-acyl-sn-glycerol-3-phosphate acyltransferase